MFVMNGFFEQIMMHVYNIWITTHPFFRYRSDIGFVMGGWMDFQPMCAPFNGFGSQYGHVSWTS